MSDMISIEKLSRKGKKYQATTNLGIETFTEDDVVTHHLLKGAAFSEEEWDRIIKAKTKGAIYDKVLNYLSYQNRSEHEIWEYLDRFEVSTPEKRAVIDRIKALNFIDDERLALDVANAGKASHKGPLYIREKLRTKGLDDVLISKVLALYPEEEEHMAIRALIDAEQPKLISFPARKQKEKLYEKLLRDGFSVGPVLTQLEKTVFESCHVERLADDFSKIKQQTADKAKIISRLLQKGYEYAEIKKIMEAD